MRFTSRVCVLLYVSIVLYLLFRFISWAFSSVCEETDRGLVDEAHILQLYGGWGRHLYYHRLCNETSKRYYYIEPYAYLNSLFKFRPETNYPILQRPNDCPSIPVGELLILVGIKTMPSKVALRNALRNTWLNPADWADAYSSTKIHLYPIFLLGDDSHATNVHEEADKYGDILQYQFSESHYNLTVKDNMFFEFFQTSCPNADYILKGDDDILLIPENLLGHLDLINSTTQLIGCMHRNEEINRNIRSKYYMPSELVPMDHYPNYFSGAAYLITKQVASELAAARFTVPMLPLDDTWVGVLINSINRTGDMYSSDSICTGVHVVPKGSGGWSMANDYDDPCFLAGLTIYHRYPSPERLRKAYQNLRQKNVTQLCHDRAQETIDNVAKKQRGPSLGKCSKLFVAKQAVKNVVTRETQHQSQRDFTIEDWGRKIHHQQEESKEFQKQLQKYIASLRQLANERTKLIDLLVLGYPAAWGSKEKIIDCQRAQEDVFDDCISSLNMDTMNKLTTYSAMFPELKNQIARLERRRIDLDSAKDSFEKVKQAKAVNSGKVQRVKSTMDNAQEKFDSMSRQLREDLPQVYSSRAGLIGYIFGSWIKQEMEMHSQLDQENIVIEKLMIQLQRDHTSGKLRSTTAESSRQSNRGNSSRESESSYGSGSVQFPRHDSTKDKKSPRKSSISNLPIHIPLRVPARPPSPDPQIAQLSDVSSEYPDPTPANEVIPKTKELSHDYVDIDQPLEKNANDPVAPEDIKKFSKREAPSPPQQKENCLSTSENKAIARTVSDSVVSERASLDLLVKTKSLEIAGPPVQSNPRFKEAPNHVKMARTSSRADDEQGGGSQNIHPHSKLQNFDFIEEEPQELILKTEPEPNKAVIEARSPSPVKIVNAAQSGSPSHPPPVPPPPYSNSQSSVQMPDGYERTVVAVYNYSAADEDELCFNKGDLILVIKHPQPDEQDEGWLLGIRKSVWESNSDLKASWGLFPENFTKALD
ncbi:Oidioi.mRNA.OKI2018_I69.XSR.g15494.t1.cds [Oikopleura dioica]|uniref:Oidioi.mRNA.OKI2018_I69.XSR.g15494.t1.cds n=1 Tax=Oikopleura dioica TaxID=34765 RepID=A0ABN7SH34_OIKDI|nr:Oidioi.mRNA.OKI2018_I69.XSR.g15494.t1.cds [Oikopleura dioica]